MPDSFRAVLRVAGTVLVSMALCLALVAGIAACGGGDEATDTTAEATSGAVGPGTTGVEDTVVSESGSTIDEALIGKWHSAQTAETLEFTSDGKMIIIPDGGASGAVEFPYRAEGSNVVYGPAGFEITVPYSIDGDVLTIVNPDVGGPVTLDRVN